jgi:hypothetical protein
MYSQTSYDIYFKLTPISEIFFIYIKYSKTFYLKEKAEGLN